MKRSDICKREGKRLRKMRIERGLSQRALGEFIGVSQAAISYFELGKIDSLSLYIQAREKLSTIEALYDD